MALAGVALALVVALMPPTAPIPSPAQGAVRASATEWAIGSLSSVCASLLTTDEINATLSWAYSGGAWQGGAPPAPPLTSVRSLNGSGPPPPPPPPNVTAIYYPPLGVSEVGLATAWATVCTDPYFEALIANHTNASFFFDLGSNVTVGLFAAFGSQWVGPCINLSAPSGGGSNCGFTVAWFGNATTGNVSGPFPRQAVTVYSGPSSSPPSKAAAFAGWATEPVGELLLGVAAVALAGVLIARNRLVRTATPKVAIVGAEDSSVVPLSPREGRDRYGAAGAAPPRHPLPDGRREERRPSPEDVLTDVY
jgi:hypothetical protein